MSTELSERYKKIKEFKIRYDLYPNFYSELNSIVDDIKLCENNRNKKEKSNQIKLLEKEIRDFQFFTILKIIKFIHHLNQQIKYAFHVNHWQLDIYQHLKY